MNKFFKNLFSATLFGLLTQANAAFAEDTDVYAVNTDAAITSNVLIIIDNSSNWAANNQGWAATANCAAPCKQGQAELNALRIVTKELNFRTKLGLMMFSSGAVDGAYIRWGLRSVNAINKPAFSDELIGTNACPVSPKTNTNSVSSTPNCIYKNFSSGPNNESINAASVDYSSAMFEAFKYFGGYTSPEHAFDDVEGTPQDATHFGKEHRATLDARHDTSAYTADKLSYAPPAIASCAKNYIIFIGNGYPTQDSPASLLAGVGGETTQLEAPDFVTVSGNVETQLGSASIYASQAACEAAALATYGSQYTSYTCKPGAAGTTSTTLGTTSCGQYVSAAACANAATLAFPGHGGYSCTVAGSCSGTYNLGTSTCGQYASAAACQTGLTALGYTSPACAASASTCTPSVDLLNSGTGQFATGNYATPAACQAAAAIAYPGYSSYICVGAAGVSTNLGTSACYASSAACNSASAALYPGYSGVGCATPVACTPVLASPSPCAASSTYNTAAKCNAGAPTILGATYASYSCTAGANCTDGKTWAITGTNNKYSVTGTGYAWTVTGTTAVGSRFDMTGTGGNKYTMTASDTYSEWIPYGNVFITMSIPTGTFTTTSPNNADEWAKFLATTDVSSTAGQQSVVTYTIDVFKDQQDTEETKLLMNMARNSGGKYFTATDENAIMNALRKILAEIQSVNSVFASSSLPVSVNTQGTYLNQVFMGMFRPKGDATPRWMGNLKQYKMGMLLGKLSLVDRYGEDAVSGTTGFIAPCADSFWSTDTRTYWKYPLSTGVGNCRAQLSKGNTSSFFSDAPDGDVVEKGGAAHRLRGTTLDGWTIVPGQTYATRNLMTCDAACSTFLAFDNSNAALTSAAFGIASTPVSYQDTFIDWVRGQDVDEERATLPASPNESRPSIHGGVIHSQPAVVDYGGTTGVIAYYGSDDMVFHATNGGQNDTDGNELWGFIAPEFYKKLHRLRDNGSTTPVIDFPGVNPLTPQAPKEYGFDGAIGIYQKGATVWIFPTQRRGGRAIYGLDVSNPASPSIKWRKGCFTDNTASDGSCTTDWSGIGQTWSKPVVTYLKGSLSPVLVFGGGYDTCEDTNSQIRCAGARKGANIWFVDADTGAIIRTYPTNYSVPGDITTVTDQEGNLTHVYVGDTGGYVYRVNVGSISGTTPSGTAWSPNGTPADITIADLGGANHALKFIFGPAVVQQYGFNAVLIGSGDREHPLMTDYACPAVQNQYFMLIDKPNSYLSPVPTAADLVNVNSGSATFNETNQTISNNLGVTSTNGWKFDFGSCEQAVNKGLVISGSAYFGTNQPATSVTACETDLGIARGYKVDFLTGNSDANSQRSAVYTGGGMPPSPVAGVVNLGDAMVPFCIGCIKMDEPCGPSCAMEPPINPVSARFRSYWYLEND